VAFTKGFSDIVGSHLHLDHIHDWTVRPLDQLLRDHFLQGLLKYVKGAMEAKDYRTENDLLDDIRERTIDLSSTKWDTPLGQTTLELHLKDRLRSDRLFQAL